MQKAKISYPDFSYEKKLWQQGHKLVVGLDEVGRGPLAGPVCAAAICLSSFFVIPGEAKRRPGIQNHGSPIPPPPRLWRAGRSGMTVRVEIEDSKKLTVKQREAWYKFLTTHKDIKWGVGIVSEKIIDKINILEATKLAMRRAIEALGLEPDYLLLDGNFLLEDLSISQIAVTRGDAKIWSCAAASIIAKVTRDRLMQKYHKKYPQYGFDKHKGYGTPSHIIAIKNHGPCAIHRQSFKPIRN